MQVEQVKLNRKILYHFVIFTKINEKIIKKDRQIYGNINIVAKRDSSLYLVTKILESNITHNLYVIIVI